MGRVSGRLLVTGTAYCDNSLLMKTSCSSFPRAHGAASGNEKFGTEFMRRCVEQRRGSRIRKLWILLGVCGLGLSSAYSKKPQGPDIEKLTEKRDELHAAGKYAEAIPIAEQVLKLSEEKYGP